MKGIDYRQQEEKSEEVAHDDGRCRCETGDRDGLKVALGWCARAQSRPKKVGGSPGAEGKEGGVVRVERRGKS